jgi:hypothetical protein
VVEPQACALLGGQGLAIHGDRVGGGHVDGGALQNLAVKGHATFRDHRLHITAGGDSCAGDDLGDPILGRLLGLSLSLGPLLAGSARALFRRAVEAARALVAATTPEGTVSILATGAERLVASLRTGAEGAIAFLTAGAEGLVSAFRARTAGPLVVVTAAERLVAAFAGLARAVIIATGAEGAVPILAGFAEGPFTSGGAATVGAPGRTAPTIIVVAVGHGSLIAEESNRSEGQ